MKNTVYTPFFRLFLKRNFAKNRPTFFEGEMSLLETEQKSLC